MQSRNISLLKDEEILFEAESAIITNQRLLANWIDDGTAMDEAFLRDITSPQRVSGGQKSRMKQGLQLLGVGVVSLVVQFAGISFGKFVDISIFIVGALAITVGLYFALGSLFLVKPHTTLFFPVPGVRDDIIVAFPGWDNTDAEDLTRRLGRAKRGL